MKRSCSVVLGVALLVQGCGWTQVERPRVSTYETPQGAVEVKTRAARPVSTSIIWDAILVELESAPVCQQRVWGVDQAEIRERNDGRRRFGKAAPYLGLLGIVGGGVLLVSEITSDDISPVLVPASVVVLTLGIGLALIGKPLQRTTFRTRTEQRPGRSYVTETKCPSDVGFAFDEEVMKTYRLDTPWGTSIQGAMSTRPEFARTVWFSTNFHDAPFLYDDDATTKLRSGWTLHLGGDPIRIELNEKQADRITRAGRQTALERGRFPPDSP